MIDRPVRDPGTAGGLLPEAVYRRALELGRGAAGLTGPNPPVGCVIVRSGSIVGEGATRPVGGDHAEVVALAAAGASAAGATAVVTLEPCAHQGRTPPCTDALLAAGITEVHVLHGDPDPVAAGGSARLEAAGVAVVDVGARRPDLGASAAHDLRGFVTRVRAGRPYVVLKIAQTPDGGTVPARGAYLTGPVARRAVHALRADVDAVLVGGATVRHDDPRLDVRDVADVTAVRQPRPVVLSASGAVPPTARAARPGGIALLGACAPEDMQQALRDRGVTVVTLPTVGDGRLDLREALTALLEHRVLTLLAEPGVRLGAALLADGLVDRVELHVAGGAMVDPMRIRPAIPALVPLLGAVADEGAEEAGSIAVTDVSRSGTPDGDLICAGDVAVLAPALERVG